MKLYSHRSAVQTSATGVCVVLLLVLPTMGTIATGESTTPTPAAQDRHDSVSRDELIDELRKHALPLHRSDDLDPLLALIGDRRAVLLGEASHGTEEYYAWRAELSKRLIVEKGFRFIAVEGDWGACAAVNRYVKHLDDAPATTREALAGFTRWPTWLWSNQVILELVDWLRAHNAGLPKDERVGFYGIDVYGLTESMDKAPRYLRLLDHQAAEAARAAYECLRPDAKDIRRYLQRVQDGDSCEKQIASVVELLRTNREAWSAKDRDAYFHAKQNALVVKNAERHYRTIVHQDHSSWNARARHFHLTLERLLDFYGESSRGIVWAHNTHIGDAHATSMAQSRQVNIGQLTRESLGRENVALIGFSTHRGMVVAGRQWEAPKQVMPIARARPGSLEDLLHRVSESPFLLVMDDVRDLSGLDRRIGHRAIGVSFNPRQEHLQYVPTVLPDRYDAMLFIPETSALREIKEALGEIESD